MNGLVQAVITTTVFLPLVFGCGGGDVFTNTVELRTSADIANANYILQRVDGVWQALGTGCNQAVKAIAINKDNGIVYIAGNFTEAGGDADCNYIAQWDGASFTPLGVGLDGNVNTLAVAPNGDLYVGGGFTDIFGGGGGTYNYLAMWDSSSWNAVGAGLNGSVTTLAFDSTGLLYIGGNFTDTQGGPGGTYSRICTWDGTAFAVMDGGVNASVSEVTIDSNDYCYVVGSFTEAGGVSGFNRVCYWDGTSWQLMGTGCEQTMETVAIGSEGLVYVTGSFITIGGVSANYIAKWDGTVYLPLGDSPNGAIYSVLPITRNEVMIAGNWTTLDIGGGGGEPTGIADSIATWNGSGWLPLDIDLPGIGGGGAAAGYVLAQHDNKLYLGFNGTGTATTSSGPVVTVTHDGTTRAFPTITITRSGGTTAVLESIQNLTTGKVLLFDHAMLDGEKIVIDLTPGHKTITTYVGDSTNNALDSLLPGSDFGTFALAPGDNDIALYISESGSPTLTAHIQWQTTYPTIDGATS